ncbi:tetratricopeptide repeat protein [Marinococcus sp. PL1-022]|uniref:tetratricopeptide repeat protein n=1 Tax=Marinococcus sp. PL1-022 TaxID=3095363 RepID=UPI0029C2A14D|nr:tetratricopeptide repeat protein [Marinococcus sp. PL1-022]MDX6151763.1 tetratricopeptide repeat protein [Marinococcus sp. PL1-022]
MGSKQKNEDAIIPFLQSGEYFFQRGVVAYQKNHLKRAVLFLERAVELEPSKGLFQCQLAAIYTDMEWFDRSNNILDRVLKEVEPERSECYFFLANNYAFQGNFEKAAETAGYYMKIAPEGDFAEETKELLEMIKENEPGLLEHPGDMTIYEQAVEQADKGRVQEARELFEKLLKQEPDYWAAYHQLAKLHQHSGDTEQAVKLLETVHQEGAYVPASCQLAALYESKGEHERSKEVMSVLTAILPVDRESLHWISAVCTYLGYYEDACRYARLYHKRFVIERGSVAFYHGAALYLLGETEQAAKWWKQNRQLDHPEVKELYREYEQNILTGQRVREMVQDDFQQ